MKFNKLSTIIIDMKYEVDQSGRIEETNRHTIISVASKDYSYTLKIDSKIKRLIQKKFQNIGKPKMFGIYGFVSGLIILLKKSKVKDSVVIIDIEYDGHNKVITNELIKNTNQNLEFRFANIGKKSPAHKKAYIVFKKYDKPNYKIGLIEFEKLIMKMVK